MGNKIYIHPNTPKEVERILLDKLYTPDRIRIFYGDDESGEDWCEELDVMGYVRYTPGNIRHLLLLPLETSTHGSEIMTNKIVKITCNKEVLYQHPKYHHGLELKEVEGYWSVVRHNPETDLTTTFMRTNDYKKGLKYYNFLIGKANKY